jgi:hypothetical protein
VWNGLFDEPVFVLTSDQDWAPSWAADRLLRLVADHSLPVHFFRTNPCPAIDAAVAASPTATQGWHPNFLPGSSHGANAEEVIGYMRRHFPSCRTVRSHTFVEGSAYWTALAAAGIVADSQLPTVHQSHLQPLLYWAGILRFPVYFEDDVFFEWEADGLSLETVKKTLFTPGLKILNFHATFVACNISSGPHYKKIRSDIFGSVEPPDLNGPPRGTRTIFDELVASILGAGHRFESFESVVDRVIALIASDPERFPRPFSSRFHA